MQIRTYAQLVSVITSMEANLPTFAGDLGTTAADQTFLTNSLANLNYVQGYCDVIDDNKKSYTGIKQRLYSGDGGLIPDGPSTAAFNPPFPLQGDIHGLTMLLIRRIEASPAYTKEIGLALGIYENPSDPLFPGDITPTISLEAAQSGALFSVVVSGREESDSWIVEIMRTGGDSWQNAGTFTGKSADVTITLTNPGQPEQIQVRVRLRKNNANYGNVSAALTITINP